MHLKLIYNPAAGRGKARRHADEIERYLVSRGASVDVHASASPADLTRVAAESSAAGYDRVVVCGGDGTVHLAVREFDLSRGVLGIIPLGSGDDFARVTGIPRTLRAACDTVLDGRIREVDVATANGTRYLGVAGLGFDSEVAAYAQNVKVLRGSIVYLYSILRVLAAVHAAPRADANRRGGARRGDHVCGRRQHAPVRRRHPHRAGGGVVDDGVLDFCIVHRTSRFQLLITLPLAYNGTHVRKPFVESGRGREFLFDSDTAARCVCGRRVRDDDAGDVRVGEDEVESRSE